MKRRFETILVVEKCDWVLIGFPHSIPIISYDNNTQFFEMMPHAK